MRIGFIGAGSMATALARGIGERALFTSAGGDRARELAQSTGGSTAASNAELAEAADVVFLCHKPAQLDQVAAEAGSAKAIVSVVATASVADLERLYPDRPVYRIMAGIPAEIGRGPICLAAGGREDAEAATTLRSLLDRCGSVVEVADELFEPAMALMGCGPAFMALVAEAFADAGTRHGLDHGQAIRLVTETMAATAAYLEQTDYDAPGLRARVATRGGLTERGLVELEDQGLRRAVDAGVDLVVEVARA